MHLKILNFHTSLNAVDNRSSPFFPVKGWCFSLVDICISLMMQRFLPSNTTHISPYPSTVYPTLHSWPPELQWGWRNAGLASGRKGLHAEGAAGLVNTNWLTSRRAYMVLCWMEKGEKPVMWDIIYWQSVQVIVFGCPLETWRKQWPTLSRNALQWQALGGRNQTLDWDILCKAKKLLPSSVLRILCSCPKWQGMC